MQIIDLSEAHQPLYFVCLEDWSDEIKDAADHKKNWFHTMKNRGLRVKLAVDDSGEIGGMIQYLPIEESFAEGKDLYMVLCIWVHGHKKGRGNFQKQGMGKALIQAAEDDVKALGAKGLAAWGLAIPAWMKASWFKKQGYVKTDKQGVQVLLWKAFEDSAEPPKWIAPNRKRITNPDSPEITIFKNGWCPAFNMVYERTRNIASEYGEVIRMHEIDTTDRDTYREWGISDGIFINGKELSTGPPPSEKKIRKKIAKAVKKYKN